MARSINHATGQIYLHPYGTEEELDATFEVEVETYPAEPFSYGGGRGTETTVTATLMCWTRHGETFDRGDAVSIDGEDEVIRQEEAFGETYEPEASDPGEYGEWLRDRAIDRQMDSDMRAEARWAAE